MKLSTRVRYATRIMLDMAIEKGPGPITGKCIAEREGIPRSYLKNIMSSLSNVGLLRATRGTSGGFVLAKPPAQIKLSDIWSAVEGPVCLIDCTHQPDICPRYEKCVPRYIWEEAEQALNNVLESWSLEDMIRKAELGKSDNQ